jgi:hypothetical protein
MPLIPKTSKTYGIKVKRTIQKEKLKLRINFVPSRNAKVLTTLIIPETIGVIDLE